MPSIKVLLADDNDGFRCLLTSFLNVHADVDIVGEAADGLDAVEKAVQTRPDIVLMDLEMPLKDGFDATREIKQRLPKTRVVILSAYSSEVYRRAARGFGADGFIDKNNMRDALVALFMDEELRRRTTAANAA